MSEEVALLKKLIERVDQDYEDVKKIYNDYLLLKEKLGKPTKVYPLDPEKIRKDLSSEEFFELLQELKVRK